MLFVQPLSVSLWIISLFMADGTVKAKRLGGSSSSRYLVVAENVPSGTTSNSFNNYARAPEDTNTSTTSSPGVTEESVNLGSNEEPSNVQGMANATSTNANNGDEAAVEDVTTVKPTDEPTPEKEAVIYNYNGFIGEFLLNATVLEAERSDTIGFRIEGPFIPAAGKLFFLASTTEAGVEPWVTDGTMAGTKMVKDIYPGSEGSIISTAGFASAKTAEIDGNLLFFARDGKNGNELWKSDGTEEGTVLVRDMENGEEGIVLTATATGDVFAKLNDTLYFSQTFPNSYVALLETDATLDGTHSVREESILSGLTKIHSVVEKTKFDGQTYIVAEGLRFSGKKLWMTTGIQNASTYFDFWTIDETPKLVEFKDKIYFGSNKKLFYTDGTVEGKFDFMTDGVRSLQYFLIDTRKFNTHATVPSSLLLHISKGTNPVADALSFLKDVVTTKENLFFVSACRLWKYDGESKPILLMPDVPVNPSPDSVCPLGLNVQRIGENSVLFLRNDEDKDLWVSDGSVEGTRRLNDATISTSAQNPILVNTDNTNLAFVTVEDDTAGTPGDSLWATDGSQENFGWVSNVGSTYSFRVRDMVVYQDNLIVSGSATKGGPVNEMWRVPLGDATVSRPVSAMSRTFDAP